MIAYEELCQALDQFNARKNGNVQTGPALEDEQPIETDDVVADEQAPDHAERSRSTGSGRAVATR